MNDELRIAIIVGSTRPNRKARVVAEWVEQLASARRTAHYELLDLVDFKLPLLDEPSRRRAASIRSRTPGRGRRQSRNTTATCS